MDEKSRKRYFLIKNDLYELTINFMYQTFRLDLLDPLTSTKIKPNEKKYIICSDFSAYKIADFENLEEIDKDTLSRISILLTKQILRFKYGNAEVISIIENYEKAYDRWKLNNSSKEETKECKLDDVILDKEIKEDVLSTINFVKNMEKYK